MVKVSFEWSEVKTAVEHYVKNRDEGIIYLEDSEGDSVSLSLEEAQTVAAELTRHVSVIKDELVISPGDWVRVIGRSFDECFDAGDTAQITAIDPTGADRFPYKIRSVGDNYDWISADAVVKITPAEAKAALIAEIESLFAPESSAQNPQEVA